MRDRFESTGKNFLFHISWRCLNLTSPASCWCAGTSGGLHASCTLWWDRAAPELWHSQWETPHEGSVPLTPSSSYQSLGGNLASHCPLQTLQKMKSFLSNWQTLQCLSYLAIDVRVSVLKKWRNKVCEDNEGHTTGATMRISLSPWPYTSYHNNPISSFQSTISPFMYRLIGLQWIWIKIIIQVHL